MNTEGVFVQETEMEGKRSLGRVGLDLVVLRFMARTIIRLVQQPEQSLTPLKYHLNERHKRQHRVIIFAPEALRANEDMCWVGFVSQRSRAATSADVEMLFLADEVMMAELPRMPGLFSYSSLELHPGIWYNFVLFSNESMKNHVKGSNTHRHAAYQLAPAYYAWIRLYNGTLSGGLAGQAWQLLSTKYYYFPGISQQNTPEPVREPVPSTEQ